MSNSFTYQVLKDTTEHAVIKLTASFDGSGQESNAVRIQANTLVGAMDTSKANLLSSSANTGGSVVVKSGVGASGNRVTCEEPLISQRRCPRYRHGEHCVAPCHHRPVCRLNRDYWCCQPRIKGERRRNR